MKGFVLKNQNDRVATYQAGEERKRRKFWWEKSKAECGTRVVFYYGNWSKLCLIHSPQCFSPGMYAFINKSQRNTKLKLWKCLSQGKKTSG